MKAALKCPKNWPILQLAWDPENRLCSPLLSLCLVTFVFIMYEIAFKPLKIIIYWNFDATVSSNCVLATWTQIKIKSAWRKPCYSSIIFPGVFKRSPELSFELVACQSQWQGMWGKRQNLRANVKIQSQKLRGRNQKLENKCNKVANTLKACVEQPAVSWLK